MLSEAEARKFAQLWVEAWNAHDLDAVMSRYAADVVLTSPTAARLLGDASGRVVGRDAVRRYFERGLEAYPELRFELLDVMWGISTVVLYYVNQKGTRTAEFMELNDGVDFERKIYVKQQAAWLLRQEFKKVKQGEEIAIGTATAP